METRDLIQEVYFECTPGDLYTILMDAEHHAAFSGGEAIINQLINGKFSVYNGYITGKNVLLEPGKLIVQEWKADEMDWPEGHHSVVRFEMAPKGKGTQLTFVQKGIPSDVYEDISNGWKEYYWDAINKYIEELREG